MHRIEVSPTAHPTWKRYRRLPIFGLGLALLIGLGCGGSGDGGADGEEAGGHDSVATSPAPEVAGEPGGGVEDSSDMVAEAMLPRPFSGEQIRQSWVEGLVVVLENTTPEGVQLQRWTVVSTDEEGAEIEFAMTDADGVVQGEPAVQRSGWEELAAHGDFPAANTSREGVSRPTPIGALEGWLYTQTNEEADSVTESFFSDAHAGAPVLMKVTQSGTVTLEMAMIGWTTP